MQVERKGPLVVVSGLPKKPENWTISINLKKILRDNGAIRMDHSYSDDRLHFFNIWVENRLGVPVELKMNLTSYDEVEKLIEVVKQGATYYAVKK